MKKFKTGVLVRDKRIDVMQNKGIKVHYEILNDDNFIIELKKKLVEESTELLKSNNKDEIIEELSDVAEVFEQIVSTLKLDINEINKIKKEKQSRLGSFRRKIKLLFVEMDENIQPEYQYHLSHPEKYPEIIK